MKKKEFYPLVSIIIPVYNGENFMKQAIDSALNQTYDKIEVIVVDDGSIDNTNEIAKSYGNKIRYYKKENGGVASAFNYGISKMKGEYFSWLSHDDVYDKNKIKKQIDLLSELKDKKTILFSNFGLINSKGEITSKTNFSKKAKLELINSGIYPVLCGMVNGNTILIHKDIFNDIGLFNENHKTSSDYEMWYAIFKKYKHFFMNDCLAYYRIHSAQDTNTSTVYSKESDELWQYIINNITDDDFKLFNVSKYQIYINLYMQMKYANLKEAASLAYNLAKNNFENPSISVLMPVYNCEKYVSKAIESILNQTFGDFELIIINDCTPDNSMAIVSKYANKDFRIKVLENEKNLGVGKTIDKGIKHAKGKYITRLDSDDTADVDRLLLQYMHLEQLQYDYCATNINLIDQKGNITSCDHYTVPTCPIEFALAFTNPIPNATIMYKLDIIRKNKLSFGDFKVAEDYNFLVNYSKHGKGDMLESSLYNYRILSDSLFHKMKDDAIDISISISNDYYEFINGCKMINPISFLNEFYENRNNELFKKEINKDTLYNIVLAFPDIVDSFAKKFNYDEIQKKQCISFLTDKLLYLYDNYIISLGKEVLIKDKSEIKKQNIFQIVYQKVAWYYNHNGFKKTFKWLLLMPFKKLRRSND